MVKSKGCRFVFVILVLGFISSCDTMCASEDDPRYWAKKIKEPAFREQSTKMLGELYNKALEKAQFNESDPEVVKVRDQVVPVLLDTFNKYKTDNINRSNILAILARIADERAIPAFEELLDYQEGINETDASKGAEALGVLGSDASIPKIVGMVKKAQVARKSRGEGSRNRPEEDWITRSAIAALQTILVKKPNTSNRQEALNVLISIMETTADEQDFFLNMKAATALGDIGDPTAIPILIRGLFMQGRGATIYQQCRVALCKIAIENRAQMMDGLLKAYKGEDKVLEEDAVKYAFIQGVKEDKIGRIFAELGVTEQHILDEMMKKLADPDPAVSGFTAISLGQIGYAPALDKMVDMITDKEAQLGTIPGIVEAFEYFQNPKKTSELLFAMMTDKEKWDRTFRLRSALALSKIAGGEYLDRYQKAVSEEEDEEVRKEMVEFTERFQAAKDCGEDAGCWLGKLNDSSWRIQEKALFTLLRMIDSITPDKVNDVTVLMRSTNQDVLKVVFMLINKTHPGGCQPSKSCDRLKKIIPYWRAKPQFKVRANDAECLLAVLLHRQGGKLADLHAAVAVAAEAGAD